jgi:RHS repeat-associated protein
MTSSDTRRRSNTSLIVAALLGVASTLLGTRPAAAQDAMQTDPIQDGMGGPTTLTPPAFNTSSSVAQGLTGGAQLTIDPSTGFAVGSFAFQLPKARGDAQPGLALTYNSSNATVVGFAGLGWTLSTTSITRRGAAGLPRFTDDVFTATAAQLAAAGATFDDYVVDGRALVPICLVGSCTSAQLVSGEKLPTALLGTSLTGWMYFRPEVDDRARYFFSPTGQTWIKQEQSGVVTQYGHPLDTGSVDPSLSDAIERPSPWTRTASGFASATAAYRWAIVRQTDAVGNIVYYAWTNTGAIAPSVVSPGTLYLSDIYDTLAVGQSPAPASFAHHTHLTWQLGPSGGPLYTPIWRAAPMAQLATVDVTSASWLSTARGLVRRYNLAYTPNAQGTRNRLASITLEGECETPTNEPTPVPEVNDVVPNPSGCPNPATLTLASYTYARDPISSDQVLDTAWPSFPDFGEPNTAARLTLVDVNGDGASDLLYQQPSGFAFLPLSHSALNLPDPVGAVWFSYFEQNRGSFWSYPLNLGNWLSDGVVDWLVENGTGTTAFSPLSGTFTAGTSGGTSSILCGFGNAVDVDGDGLTDCVFQTSGSQVVTTAMSQRQRAGVIQPFAMSSNPGYGAWDGLDWTTYLQQFQDTGLTRSMADVDGDGLADSVALVLGLSGPATFYVWPNHGDGGFGVNSGLNGLSDAESFQIYPNGLDDYGDETQGDNRPFNNAIVTMADVDLDGIAEVIQLTSERLYVCHTVSQSCYSISLPPNQPAGCGQFPDGQGGTAGPFLDPATSFLSVSDVDGTGVPRVIFQRSAPVGGNTPCMDTSVYEVKLAPGNSPSLGVAPTTTFPGLLVGQTLLGGEQQTLTYQPLRALPSVNPIPSAGWVVMSIATGNGIASSPFGLYSTVFYNYTGAIYDPRDAQFVGFQKVTETHTGDAGAPGLVRTTTYATTACGAAASGTACTGQNDYGWFRAIRGVPVVTVDADTAGATNTTTTYKYADQSLYTGLDGRVVRKVPRTEQSQYQWTPGAGAKTANSSQLPFTGLGTSPYEVFSSTAKFTTALPPGSGTGKATHKATWSESPLGDERASVDFGQEGVDTPIRTETKWELAKGDTTTWSYRPKTKVVGYTTTSGGGTLATPPARSYAYTYTALGQLLTETASLPNEPAPMSAAGGFAAGTPPDATTSTTVCITGCTSGAITGIQYDRYGNATTIPGPNNRCTSASYDALFAQLPQTTVRWGAGCNATSGPAFTTASTYDRGFAEVVQKTSPYSGVVPLVTMMKYEPFGRLAEVDQPSEYLAGVADTTKPAVLTQYNDQGPVRLAVSETVDGTEVNPVYATHYKAIDGLGQTLYDADQFDQSGRWSISQLHTRYRNGLTQHRFQPFLFGGDPTAYATVGGAAYDSDTTSYDGANRPVAYLNFDNKNPTTYTYAFNQSNGAQCVTTVDPEQQPSGLHPGSSTVRCSDGHGRAIKTIQNLAHGESGLAYSVTTATTYTATGERTSITQSSGTSQYARQMTYDSLGRMVGQTEPNTGTWQYAYNDSGDLVGLEDPRGCGKVIYHDGLGRVIAEDYSPCASSYAPAYSPPNLATGDGTEAFYVYDGYGDVAAAYDRAQTSINTFDPRSRPQSVERRIAVPGGSDVLGSRYAPQAYDKAFTAYSEANRVLAFTTGADAPDLVSSGQSQIALTYAITGSLQTVGGSYGPLIAGQTFDASGRLIDRYYADAAGTNTNMVWDNKGELTTYAASRGRGPWATYVQGNPPGLTDFTTQSFLIDLTLTYDQVGNPLSLSQGIANGEGGDEGSGAIIPSEWPAGAVPTRARDLTYWDDYRLSGLSTSYATPTEDDIADAPGNPYTVTEVQSSAYPTQSPEANRVRAQSFTYDFRGNVTLSSDDMKDIWDRGLGGVTYVTSGNDRLTGFAAGGTVTYDSMGNIATLNNPHGDTYEFAWDEMGRLALARREDAGGTITTESYAYDASGERVVTQKAPAGSTQDVYTVNVFDSLVLRNASYPDANGDYEHDDATEHAYIRAGGETLADVFVDTTGTLPSASPPLTPHVYITVGDPQGSSSFIIDEGTSELVEASSYLAYGGVDMDYRPARWNSFREDRRYTGQWDNAEVGLVYMHARYYLPELGRFVSPDPKTIQGGGIDNPFAYANGSPFRFTDPTGLVPQGGCDALGCWAQDPDQNHQDPTTGALTLGETIISAPVPVPQDTRSIPDTSSIGPSNQNFNYVAGYDTSIATIPTPREQQDLNLQVFTNLGLVGVGAFAPAAKAVDFTSILEGHLDAALEQYAATGLTDAQLADVLQNPGREAMHAGTQIDTLFKQNVAADPLCGDLCITPRGQFGPDVYHPASQQWWDVTTLGSWSDHVSLYSGGYGTGNPLLYGGVTSGGN